MRNGWECGGKGGAGMAEIFISYRRDDTGILCERLAGRLSARFGAQRVFRDTSAITVGSAWEQVLHTALQDCYVVIALIGIGWLSARDAQGCPRLFDPHDFVRLELATALAQRKRIVPVLADGARMPQPQELPPDLAPLAQIPPLVLRPDPYFEADLQALMQIATPGARKRIPHPAVALYGLTGLLGVVALLAAVVLPDNPLDALLFNLYLLGMVAMLLGGGLIIVRSIAAHSWLWPAFAAPVIALLLVSAAGVFAAHVMRDAAQQQAFVYLTVFTQPLALVLALAFGFFGPMYWRRCGRASNGCGRTAGWSADAPRWRAP